MAAFEAWLVLAYTCSECCWRTSTEKNTCGIARFPCGSTAFLLLIFVQCSYRSSEVQMFCVRVVRSICRVLPVRRRSSWVQISDLPRKRSSLCSVRRPSSTLRSVRTPTGTQLGRRTRCPCSVDLRSSVSGVGRSSVWTRSRHTWLGSVCHRPRPDAADCWPVPWPRSIRHTV